jgi:hypothetical protein
MNRGQPYRAHHQQIVVGEYEIGFSRTNECEYMAVYEALSYIASRQVTRKIDRQNIREIDRQKIREIDHQKPERLIIKNPRD